MRIISEKIFKEKNYEYIKLLETEPSIPNYTHKKFKDIIEEFSADEFGNNNLYEHQYKAFEALMSGKNVVLRAGTGSGKTEAWILYFLRKLKTEKDFYAISLYPTLALANDQTDRIKKYLNLLNLQPLLIDGDSIKKDKDYFRKINPIDFKLIITNPAFLLSDLKRYVYSLSSCLKYENKKVYLRSIYKKLNLLIIDELDFYDPRCIALILSIIKVLARFSERNLQVVILSATLTNQNELLNFLKEITGRDCEIIDGKPFRVKNFSYLVLTKNLDFLREKIKKQIRSYKERVKSILNENIKILRDLYNIINDTNSFKNNLFKVISILESIGIRVPDINIDPIDIIEEYLKDDYITIVFTKNISKAEGIVNSIKEKYGENAPIASHHHRMKDEKRKEVENKIKRGEIKVVVSPKTLAQGIDIGGVARVVHLDLPNNLRDFYQREGRKGRRKDMEFTETIIIPISRGDREVLSKGVEVFKKWLDLGLEETIINKNNFYLHLFTGMVKILIDNNLTLEKEEEEVLRRVGILLSDGKKDLNRLQEIFKNLNFYQYSFSNRIERRLCLKDLEKQLEDIGEMELIEYFQPGCLDYGEKAIVTSVKQKIDKNNGVSYIVKEHIISREIVDILERDKNFLEALKEYEKIKKGWGEIGENSDIIQSFIRDFFGGRVASKVICSISIPEDELLKYENGFGRYNKIPKKCIWILKSKKPRYFKLGERIFTDYTRKIILVQEKLIGKYEDFTYRYIYSLKSLSNVDLDLIRISMLYILVLLRRFFKIQLYTIDFDIIDIGNERHLLLYEPKSAGIIDKINFIELVEKVSSHNIDDLDLVILSKLDESAYSILISSLEMDKNYVEKIKETTINLIKDCLSKKQEIVRPINSDEIQELCSKKNLKLISYVILSLRIDDKEDIHLTAHGFYDGKDFVGSVEVYYIRDIIRPPSRLLNVADEIIKKLENENYEIVVENLEVVLNSLEKANLENFKKYLENNSKKVHNLNVYFSDISLIKLQPVLDKIIKHRKDIINKKFYFDNERGTILNYLKEKAKSILREYLLEIKNENL